jgi:hypothetical protein
VAIPAATFAARTIVTPATHVARRMSLANLLTNQPASVVTPAALAPASGGGGRAGAFARGTEPQPAVIPRGREIPAHAAGGTPAGSAIQPGAQSLSAGGRGWEHPGLGQRAGAVPSRPSAPAAMSGTAGGATEPPAWRRTTAGPHPAPESPRTQRHVGPPSTPFVGAPAGTIQGPLAPARPAALERPRPREDQRKPRPQAAGAIPPPKQGTRGIPGIPAPFRPVNDPPGPQTPARGNPAAGARASLGMGHGPGHEPPPHMSPTSATSSPASGKPAKVPAVAAH